MNGIMMLIANGNPNKAVLKYLLTIEGPAYTCRRFWDWIEPFYQDQVKECSLKANIKAHQQELEMSLRILSSIDFIKLENADLLGEDVSLRGVNGRLIPESYVMWDVINTNQYDIQVIENKQVHVVLEELLVSVTPSKPTGKDNDCLKNVVRGISSKMV